MVKHTIVLEATNPPDGTTRYIDQVVTYAPTDISFRYISLKNLIGRFDVLHVHWPEVLIRGRWRVESMVRCVLFAALIYVLRLRGVAIVRTLHNPKPHERGGKLEDGVLRLLDRKTDHFVTINPVTTAPGGRSTYIPHGHYRGRFASMTKEEPVPGRLIYAGLLRPYKGVEKLLDCFASIPDDKLSLMVLGKPTEAMRAHVIEAAAKDGRVSTKFAFVPDEELVAEITAAELVCLPYDELHNSGMLLVALSLNRPVLVPDTETTRALEDEVGPGWVIRYDGTLTPEILRDAVQSVRIRPSGTPRLDDRDWDQVAARYAAVFRQEATRHGSRRA